MDAAPHQSKTRLLDATLQVIRTKGYMASTIDDICAVAGVTKGSFFHHFKGKVDLVLAAIAHWNTTTGALFAQAPFQALDDPRDRVLAYLDMRVALVQGDTPAFTCLLGTLVQETFDSHPTIRAACHGGITSHAGTVAVDLAAAKALYVPDATWDPQVLALYTQAVIQGAFVLAKADGSAEVARACIAQLRSHVAGLLGAPQPNPAHP